MESCLFKTITIKYMKQLLITLLIICSLNAGAQTVTKRVFDSTVTVLITRIAALELKTGIAQPPVVTPPVTPPANTSGVYMVITACGMTLTLYNDKKWELK